MSSLPGDSAISMAVMTTVRCSLEDRTMLHHMKSLSIPGWSGIDQPRRFDIGGALCR